MPCSGRPAMTAMFLIEEIWKSIDLMVKCWVCVEWEMHFIINSFVRFTTRVWSRAESLVVSLVPYYSSSVDCDNKRIDVWLTFPVKSLHDCNLSVDIMRIFAHPFHIYSVWLFERPLFAHSSKEQNISFVELLERSLNLMWIRVKHFYSDSYTLLYFTITSYTLFLVSLGLSSSLRLSLFSSHSSCVELYFFGSVLVSHLSRHFCWKKFQLYSSKIWSLLI